MRPLNVLSSGVAILFSSFISDFQGPLEQILMPILVVVFFTIGANVLNDYFDYDTDKINRPDRSIVKGDITRVQALYLSLISFTIGVYFALRLSSDSQIISLGISLPLLFLYNAKIKNYPLIGNIIVSIIIGLSFIYAGVVFENVKPLIVPSLLAFGLTLIREVVKDIADLKGDEAIGARTLPIVFGKKKAIYFCTILSFLLSMAAFTLFFNGYYNIYYGVLLIITVEIPLGVVVISLLNKPHIETAKKATKLLKFCTLGGLFSIYIGTL
tara:strand:+ start:2012 stop:2821 length:810 start_codon:yes stop_codon:yes gene_type:complete